MGAKRRHREIERQDREARAQMARWGRWGRWLIAGIALALVVLALVVRFHGSGPDSASTRVDPAQPCVPYWAC